MPDVYVLYPRGVRTGGPEALHQLVHGLRSLGVSAALVPHPTTKDRPRVDAYDRYDAPESDWPADVEGSVVIAPEVHVRDLQRFRTARAFCWWLSIDNSPLFRAERRVADWRAGLADPWQPRDAKSFLELAGRTTSRWRTALRRMEHLAQSEYARVYLEDRLGINAALLTDYLADVPMVREERSRVASPRPTIAYNPAKGARLTRKVMAVMGGDVSWDAISGLPPEGVVEHLGRADVYLDLGSHPGKDRMPREAAVRGAVTVVARRGSGARPEDVPIPESHKVPVETDPVDAAALVLRRVLTAPDDAFREQLPYRRAIAAQEGVFNAEVEQLVDRIRRPRGST